MSIVSNIAARAAAVISRPPSLAGLELLASAVVVLDGQHGIKALLRVAFLLLRLNEKFVKITQLTLVH